MKAVRVERHGGPEVLAYREIDTPLPGEGEALVKVAAIGVNYVDVYHRSGYYHIEPPFIPGIEAAGTVAAVGTGVTEFQVGDRVAYATHLGGYTEYALIPARKLVKIPAGIDFKVASSILLQGLTAHFLTDRIYPVQPGDCILIHAAAGGVGQLLAQLAHSRGGRVIGTVSSEEKAGIARAAGVDEVIIYTEQDFEQEVRRLTGGEGVAAVYDAVGKTTFEKSLNSVKPGGYLVIYGATSGPIPPFKPNILDGKGSPYLTSFSITQYLNLKGRAELETAASAVFEQVMAGRLNLRIERIYALKAAAQAHRDLESRATSGKLLLLPD